MDNDDRASPSSTTISNFTSPRTVAPTSVSNDTSANFTVAPTSVPSTNDTFVPSDEGTVDVDPSDESVLATAAEASGSPTTTAAVVPIAGMGGVLTAVLFFW